MRWLPALALGLLAAAIVGGQGLARQDPPSDRLVISDGTLWLVRDGLRHAVVPEEVAQDELRAWPEGPAFGSEIPPRVNEVVVERVVPPVATTAPSSQAPEALPTAQALASPAPTMPQEWRRIARWQGNGDKNTEPFLIRGGPWRIVFTVRDPRSSTPRLCITVRTPDGGRADGGCYRRDDTTYIYKGPGTYYLDIMSADQWTVAVEDFY